MMEQKISLSIQAILERRKGKKPTLQQIGLEDRGEEIPGRITFNN